LTQLDLLAASEPREAALVRCNPDRFAVDFLFYLLDNWAVWRAFEQTANALWERGILHFGARCIGEHLRYETALRERSGDWKLNDHRWPDFARLWLLKYPLRVGFFETRVQRESTRRAA
jgi:hypothetical protein